MVKESDVFRILAELTDNAQPFSDFPSNITLPDGMYDTVCERVERHIAPISVWRASEDERGWCVLFLLMLALEAEDDTNA